MNNFCTKIICTNNFHTKIVRIIFAQKTFALFSHDFFANFGAIFARETQKNFHMGCYNSVKDKVCSKSAQD